MSCHGVFPYVARRGRKMLPPRKIYDTIVLGYEIEMLELRLQELWELVDVFVVVEVNATLTGQPKPYLYPSYRHRRLRWASRKIQYRPSVRRLGFVSLRLYVGPMLTRSFYVS